jgi:hypothetical protein
VVLRVACAASVGPEAPAAWGAEGIEVMAEAEAKPVKRAKGVALRRHALVHGYPIQAGLPIDERPFEEHR